MAQHRQLLDDAVAGQLTGAGGHFAADLDDVVDVALRIGSPRNGEAHEVHRGGLLGPVGASPKHHRAYLAATDPAGFIERDHQGLAGILKRR